MLSLLLLTACAPQPPTEVPVVPWDLAPVPPDHERRPAPVLTLTGPTEVTIGEAADLVVTGAAADERVYLVVASGIGGGPCHAGLGGLCLDVTLPVYTVLDTFSDGSGTATFTVPLPAFAPAGTTAAVQALIVRGLSGIDTVASTPHALVAIAPPIDTGVVPCVDDTAIPPGPPEPDPDSTWTLTQRDVIDASEAILPYDHHHATVAVAPDGHFAVGYDEGDVPLARVKFSLFDPTGTPLVTDLILDFLYAYAPGRPDVAWSGDSWLLTYSNATEVYLVELDVDGTVLDTVGPINVSVGTAEFQGMPDIALDGDGSGFSIVYMFGSDTEEPKGSYYQRRYDGTLTPLSDESLVGQSPLDASPPDADTLGDGYAITWTERRTACDAGYIGAIKVQRFDGGGSPLGEAVRVDRGDLGEPASRPGISGTTTGRFAVAWRAQGIDRRGVGARLQVFDPAGRRVGETRTLAAEDASTANRPAVATLDDILVVAWEEYLGFDQDDVFVQAIDLTTGEALVDPLRVNFGRTFDQERPDVALRSLGDGSYEVLVSYEDQDEAFGPRQVIIERFILEPTG